MESVRVYFNRLGLVFDIRETAVKIGTLEIKWYGVLIALGVMLAMIYCMVKAKDYNLNTDRMLDVIIGGIIGGVVGARLYFVIFNWSDVAGDFWKIFRVWEGGLGFYGGFIGGVAVAALICKIRKVNFLDMIDLATLGFFIGQAFGRWGNFFNQEAFGTNTTGLFGMYSDVTKTFLENNQAKLSEAGITVNPLQPVHPTFLYESALCLAGFIILHFLSKNRRFKGQNVCFYAIWYGTGRFFIEGLRTDSLYIGKLRISQVVSLIMIAGALVFIFINYRRIKKGNAAKTMVNKDIDPALDLESEEE